MIYKIRVGTDQPVDVEEDLDNQAVPRSLQPKYPSHLLLWSVPIEPRDKNLPGGSDCLYMGRGEGGRGRGGEGRRSRMMAQVRPSP